MLPSTLVGRIEQLIQDAGGQLLYLPPYSPDLNKIDRCWSWLKSRIRKQVEQSQAMMRMSERKERLQAQGKTAVIPLKRNRTSLRDYDKKLYKARQGN